MKIFNKGFTLLEVMVVILIFSIMFAAIFAILTYGRVAWDTADKRIRLQQETRRAMDVITKELRQSSINGIDDFTVGSLAGIIIFRIPQSANYIGYMLDTGDVNGDGVLNQIIRGESADIVLDSGDQISVLANDITNLQFWRSGTNYFQIQITAGKTTLQGRTLDMYLVSEVKLRN